MLVALVELSVISCWVIFFGQFFKNFNFITAKLSVVVDEIFVLCAEFQLNSAGDIQGLTPSLLSGQWQGRGPLSAAIQMAGIPTG